LGRPTAEGICKYKKLSLNKKPPRLLWDLGADLYDKWLSRPPLTEAYILLMIFNITVLNNIIHQPIKKSRKICGMMDLIKGETEYSRFSLNALFLLSVMQISPEFKTTTGADK
jgi:hypothetical protein